MSTNTTHLALGGAAIRLTDSRPLALPSASIVVPGNLRGIMAAGLAGEVRVRAGSAVESELLQHRPFNLGEAYPTGPGRLETTGLTTIAHAITSREPGVRPRAAHAERALRAALLLLDERGTRSVTLPLLETQPASTDAERQGRAFGMLVAGHLRRGSRLREVAIAGLDRAFLAGATAALLAEGATPVAEAPDEH